MKKKLTVVFTAFLILFCLPSTALAANVSQGSRGALTKQIQMNLNGLNFSCGTADGIAGARTVSAIRSFQQNAHLNGLIPVSKLTVDGVAGAATQNALFGIVRALQQKLSSLGYDAGAADGIYGSNTAAAVRRFQRAQGLTADGIAGPNTRAALARAAGAPASPSGSLKEFQNYALQNWERPVKTGILPVSSGRQFGAVRSDGRLHAGVDWYVNHGAGTPVYAMADGVVQEYLYDSFYGGTGMISVKHGDGSVARYGEITPLVKAGATVKKGQKIAVLKANSYDGGTMLHLELYWGTAAGSLTVPENKTYTHLASGLYCRRKDLLDPTFLLGL